MRIVSLEPFLTELVCSLELADNLVGVSSRCNYPEEIVAEKTVVTIASGRRGSQILPFSQYSVEQGLCSAQVDLKTLASLEPEVVITRLPVSAEDTAAWLTRIRTDLSELLGRPIKVHSYTPLKLESIYDVMIALGRDLGAPQKGLALAQRMKAQFMDWCDNFYDRMRNKKVSFIASLEPFRLGGWWIPELIKLASAESQVPSGVAENPSTTWEQICDYRPDVLVVAPEAVLWEETLRSFKMFEKLPNWETLPAVKRGEVYFANGAELFYRPTYRLIDAMAVLVSAIAGFESGYITPRDSFRKLRWLELQRHKF